MRFREVLWIVFLGFQGIEGIERLEVALEVTRARVETSPLWRLLIRN